MSLCFGFFLIDHLAFYLSPYFNCVLCRGKSNWYCLFSLSPFSWGKEKYGRKERFLRRKMIWVGEREGLGWPWDQLSSSTQGAWPRGCPSGFLRHAVSWDWSCLFYTHSTVCADEIGMSCDNNTHSQGCCENLMGECAEIRIVVVEYQSQFCWHFVSKQKKRFSSINTSTIQNIWENKHKPGLLTYNIFNFLFYNRK